MLELNIRHGFGGRLQGRTEGTMTRGRDVSAREERERGRIRRLAYPP